MYSFLCYYCFVVFYIVVAPNMEDTLTFQGLSLLTPEGVIELLKPKSAEEHKVLQKKRFLLPVVLHLFLYLSLPMNIRTQPHDFDCLFLPQNLLNFLKVLILKKKCFLVISLSEKLKKYLTVIMIHPKKWVSCRSHTCHSWHTKCVT